MKTAIGIVLTAIMAISSVVYANPRPCYEVREIRAIPPRIGLFICDSLDISGDTIYTSSGFAVVNQGVIAPPSYGEYFYLDSTNTSGFALNQESDFVSLDLTGYSDPIMWGTSGPSPVPITGHAINLMLYSVHYVMTYVFSFDFSIPHQGYSQVILNEINSHGTWNSNSNFIELYNRGSNYVDLAGWQIVCDTIYTLPQGASIHPHGFYVIDASEFPPNWDMDVDGDNIYLVNAANQTVDQVGWSSDHGEDVSFMRFPDGAVDTLTDYLDYWGYDDASSESFSDGYPSRGSYNSYDSPGLRVIGIRADTINGSVLIQWTNPIWLSVFSQIILRRSYDTFPATPFDGDLIYEGTDQQYQDRAIIPGQRAYYSLFARTSCGEYSLPDSQSQIVGFVPDMGVDEIFLPERASVLSAYPNPFNSSITLILENGQNMPIGIYDITGAKVAELTLSGGRAVWNASTLSSGVYFARPLGDNKFSPVRLIYLK